MEFTANFENLTEEEREQLLRLIQKSNEPMNKRWRADENEQYYFINGCMIDYYREDHDAEDEKLYRMGNYFRTQEEAEFELNKRLVLQQLKDYALLHNECKLDWQNYNQAKFFIKRDAGSNCLVWECTSYDEVPGQIYFSSPDVLLSAIAFVGGDKIQKYLFNVEY